MAAETPATCDWHRLTNQTENCNVPVRSRITLEINGTAERTFNLCNAHFVRLQVRLGKINEANSEKYDKKRLIELFSLLHCKDDLKIP